MTQHHQPPSLRSCSASLAKILAPRSIADIGATERPHGGWTIRENQRDFAGIGRAAKFAAIAGTVLQSNPAMLSNCGKLDFRLSWKPDGGTAAVELVL
jgi:hypothetical protein